jgi:hypothetical protein
MYIGGKISNNFFNKILNISNNNKKITSGCYHYIKTNKTGEYDPQNIGFTNHSTHLLGISANGH